MNKKNIHPFPGKRLKTKEKSPREKFQIFSAIRMPKLLRAMHSVRNLANKRYYKYEDSEKIRIMNDIRHAYKELMDAWKNAGKNNNNNNKKNYWDIGKENNRK